MTGPKVYRWPIPIPGFYRACATVEQRAEDGRILKTYMTNSNVSLSDRMMVALLQLIEAQGPIANNNPLWSARYNIRMALSDFERASSAFHSSAELRAQVAALVPDVDEVRKQFAASTSE